MNQGKLVFAQLMQHLPLTTFRRCVGRYRGEHKVQSFSCLDQFLCMAFAQLTYRESLRDIEACFRAQRSKLYHLGLRSSVARNTLANANAVRDWRIYADFAQSLIGIARRLYVNEPFGVDLQDTVYALDTTTIDLSLSVFPWAPFQQSKAAIRLHTLLDLHGNIPTFIHISGGKLHEVNVLDHLVPEPGAFYIMDRGFLDFTRLYRFHQAGSFFITRAKSNTQAQRRYSHRVDRRTGLVCDQTIILTGQFTPSYFQTPLRRIRFKDPQYHQDADLPHQQLRLAGVHHHRTVPLPLAGRTVLQMDQAAPAHQDLLRLLGERRQGTDLDCCLCLCPRRHRPETPAIEGQPLRNPTDPESHHVRANAPRSITCASRTGRNHRTSAFPLRITLGHYWVRLEFRMLLAKFESDPNFARPPEVFRGDTIGTKSWARQSRPSRVRSLSVALERRLAVAGVD